MAGTCVINTDTDAGILQVKWDWLSDASGDVSGEGGIEVSGTIVGAKFVPDTGGTAPTDLYDAQLIDSNGVDVLMGVGTDLPQSATSTSNYRTPFTADGAYVVLMGETLTPVVANAGNAKGGTIYLFLAQ